MENNTPFELSLEVCVAFCAPVAPDAESCLSQISNSGEVELVSVAELVLANMPEGQPNPFDGDQEE